MTYQSSIYNLDERPRFKPVAILKDEFNILWIMLFPLIPLNGSMSLNKATASQLHHIVLFYNFGFVRDQTRSMASIPDLQAGSVTLGRSTFD